MNPIRVAVWLAAFCSYLIPFSLYSCACCGVDNTWDSSRQKMDSYAGGIVKSLVLSEGEFHNHDLSIAVSKSKRTKDSYIFFAKEGAFVFKFNPFFMHKEIDITFISNPNYKLDNVADIYHSFIISGTLSYPPSVAIKLKINKIKAKLIIQGLGNSCVEAQQFKKWIIKPAKSGERYLEAFGTILYSK